MAVAINRRTFFKGIAAAGPAVLSGSVIAAATAGSGHNRPRRKPNIVYILADDLGYGDLGCYGQEKIQTPNIDRLCAEGMKFTQHYAGSTVCAPSRCTLMTGKHTGHASIRGNRELKPEGQYPMSPDEPTVAEQLKKAGYRTGAFGKWGLGGPGSGSEPHHRGFDEFFGFNCQAMAHNYYPLYLRHNGEKVMLEGNKNGQCGQYSHDLIVEKALDFMRHSQTQPFFAFLPFTIPHAELAVPEDSLAQYRGKLEEGKPWKGPGKAYQQKRYNAQDEPHAAFAGMVSRLDRNVGRVIDLIRELGLADNTVVFFTSDNGPHKEGGANPEFFDSNGPLRGIKRDLYEGGIRVPMIAWWPGSIRAGSVTDHQSAFWDFLPTACEIAGAEVPVDTDGLSYLPTLTGHGRQREHEYLYWEFHEHTGKQAIRVGNWKAVRLESKKSPAGPVELYDLAGDIGETDNVAARHPDIAARLSDMMRQVRTESEIWTF